MNDYKIEWDKSKPDGTIEKRTDIKKLKKIYPKFNPIKLEDGLRKILDNPEEVNRILGL